MGLNPVTLALTILNTITLFVHALGTVTVDSFSGYHGLLKVLKRSVVVANQLSVFFFLDTHWCCIKLKVLIRFNLPARTHVGSSSTLLDWTYFQTGSQQDKNPCRCHLWAKV